MSYIHQVPLLPRAHVPKSTTANKRKRTENSDSQDANNTPLKKAAQPEKITSEHRKLIMAALTDSKFTIPLKFNSVDEPGSKYSRHWREVLSKELTKHFTGQSGSKAGGYKGDVTPKQRLAIWKIISDAMDRADWVGIEKETGVASAKLRRHFRESMKKEGEKYIG